MPLPFQITVDCADPDLLVQFWAAALGYVEEPPPEALDSWDEYWRGVGVPDAELGRGADSIVHPTGLGPRIWFQVVPEPKTAKNRLHLDVRASAGRGLSLDDRRRAVLAAAARLTRLGAVQVRVLEPQGLDHFAVVMQDPEGNEFCVN